MYITYNFFHKLWKKSLDCTLWDDYIDKLFNVLNFESVDPVI